MVCLLRSDGLSATWKCVAVRSQKDVLQWFPCRDVKSFSIRIAEVMNRTSCSLAAVLLLLVLSIITNVLSTTTTKDIPATASSISHQFSASPPCYDTSSGEISTEGRFNYTVSIADTHGDADSLLHSLWISRNYIAATSSRKEISFQDFKGVIAKETDRAQADGQHDRFSGCSNVLLVQVRCPAAAQYRPQQYIHSNVLLPILEFQFVCFEPTHAR